MHDPNPADPERAPSVASRPREQLAQRLLAAAALLAALVELVLAFAAHLFAQKGYCPVELGHGSACAPLIRPRLAAVGPFTVTQFALAGSMLSIGLCGMLAFGVASQRARRLGAAILAAGAGFALGLQALPDALGVSSCALCTGLVSATLAVAVLYGVAARRSLKRHVPLVVLMVSLLVVAPLARLRGLEIGEEDTQRRAAVAQVGGDSGPTIFLVMRPGCPYCEALLVDVLGAPEVLSLLEKTRGVTSAREFAPEVKVHVRVPSVPTLLAVSATGKQIGEPIVGLQPPTTVAAWLRSVIASTD
jgi:hypothetical protein